jgi:hypothetical protein
MGRLTNTMPRVGTRHQQVILKVLMDSNIRAIMAVLEILTN